MKRRDFFKNLGALTLLGGAAACLCLVGSCQRSVRHGQPNIILVVVDDLGYGDLACYGAKDMRTPHIDYLAREGVRFTDGYVTAPVCSPSRAGLLTGRYQQRFGHEENTGIPKRQMVEDIGLPTSEISIADALKAQGYATSLVGKWHLGVQPKYHPLERGFDEFFGHLGGTHSYNVREDKLWGPIYRGRESVESDEYLTDAFTREAVEFIRRRREEPFFLLLSYSAVHILLQAPEEYQQRFTHVQDRNRRIYAAMLSAVDDGVGRILQTLREAGLEKQTLVVFVSDNGGERGWGYTFSRNDPLRAGKGELYDGGVRVPYIMRWPGRIPAGMVYRYPVSSLDLFATSVAEAGGKLPTDRAIDGVNLVPYLTGEKTSPPHEALFWRITGQRAMRSGKWKLVSLPGGAPELYDLSTDPGEENDLSQEHPETVEDLLERYTEWEKPMVKARWEWKMTVSPKAKTE